MLTYCLPPDAVLDGAAASGALLVARCTNVTLLALDAPAHGAQTRESVDIAPISAVRTLPGGVALALGPETA